MFPTTIWTTIREAGHSDRAALDRFAEQYRSPVRRYLAGRGLSGSDLEDVSQDVFVRLLSGKVLAKADRARGRFRSLLLSVVTHVLQDRQRRRTDSPREEIEVVDTDPEFDQEWTVSLVARAMERLGAEQSPYYQVIQEHLQDKPQDRNKLWIARQKLVGWIRHEIALTCRSPEEFEEEVRYLSRYVRPGKKA